MTRRGFIGTVITSFVVAPFVSWRRPKCCAVFLERCITSGTPIPPGTYPVTRSILIGGSPHGVGADSWVFYNRRSGYSVPKGGLTPDEHARCQARNTGAERE